MLSPNQERQSPKHPMKGQNIASTHQSSSKGKGVATKLHWSLSAGPQVSEAAANYELPPVPSSPQAFSTYQVPAVLWAGKAESVPWKVKEMDPHSSLLAPSLVTQTIKRLLTMQETWVQSLGWEDLEKEMATYSSILAWKITWMEDPGRLQHMVSKRVSHNWATSLSSTLSLMQAQIGVFPHFTTLSWRERSMLNVCVPGQSESESHSVLSDYLCSHGL